MKKTILIFLGATAIAVSGFFVFNSYIYDEKQIDERQNFLFDQANSRENNIPESTIENPQKRDDPILTEPQGDSLAKSQRCETKASNYAALVVDLGFQWLQEKNEEAGNPIESYREFLSEQSRKEAEKDAVDIFLNQCLKVETADEFDVWAENYYSAQEYCYGKAQDYPEWTSCIILQAELGFESWELPM